MISSSACRAIAHGQLPYHLVSQAVLPERHFSVSTTNELGATLERTIELTSEPHRYDGPHLDIPTVRTTRYSCPEQKQSFRRRVLGVAVLPNQQKHVVTDPDLDQEAIAEAEARYAALVQNAIYRWGQQEGQLPEIIRSIQSGYRDAAAVATERHHLEGAHVFYFVAKEGAKVNYTAGSHDAASLEEPAADLEHSVAFTTPEAADRFYRQALTLLLDQYREDTELPYAPNRIGVALVPDSAGNNVLVEMYDDNAFITIHTGLMRPAYTVTVDQYVHVPVEQITLKGTIAIAKTIIGRLRCSEYSEATLPAVVSELLAA